MGVYKEIRFDGHTVLVGFPRETDLEKLKKMGYEVIIDIEAREREGSLLARWAQEHGLRYIPIRIGECDFTQCEIDDERVIEWFRLTDELREPYILSTHDETLGVLLVIIHQALHQGHDHQWIKKRFESLGYSLRPDLEGFFRKFWAHYGVEKA